MHRQASGGSVLVPKERRHNMLHPKERRPTPPAPTADREDQCLPTAKVVCQGPWATSANLCRNPVQFLEAVGTFPLAYLPCHPCQSLCSVLDGQTVSGVARIPRVGSFEMQGKRDLCQLQSIVSAIPELVKTQGAPALFSHSSDLSQTTQV